MKKNAFTAFETLIAIAILAVVTAALSGALAAGRQQTANARNTVAGTQLAQALMDEIIRLPYTNASGISSQSADTGATSRPLFDIIDDYNNYTDGPTGLTDIANNPYPANLQGFNRSVTITNTTMQPTGWTVTVTGKLVQVTVALNGTTIVTLQRFVPSS